MNYTNNIPPCKNYFNVFRKGRGYFLLRATLEAVLILALFIGCAQLAKYALAIYPTVVRDGDYRVAMGKAQEYSPTINEAVTFAQDILEGLYTRTEQGMPMAILAPYIAPNVAKQRLQVSGGKGGFVQTGSLTGFFITEQGDQGITAYAELTVTQTSSSAILMDSLFFNLAIQRVPLSPENDKGWKLIGIKDCARDVYLREQQKALKEDSEPIVDQALLDFSTN